MYIALPHFLIKLTVIRSIAMISFKAYVKINVVRKKRRNTEENQFIFLMNLLKRNYINLSYNFFNRIGFFQHKRKYKKMKFSLDYNKKRCCIFIFKSVRRLHLKRENLSLKISDVSYRLMSCIVYSYNKGKK